METQITAPCRKGAQKLTLVQVPFCKAGSTAGRYCCPQASLGMKNGSPPEQRFLLLLLTAQLVDLA